LGWGFNAETGELTDMAESGVLDPVSVQKAAAYAGISGAALALTIDVLVHRQGQEGHAPRRTPAKRKQL